MKMRFTLLAALYMLCTLAVFAQEPTLKTVLDSLDKAVARRVETHRKHVSAINDMKNTLAKTSTPPFDIAEAMMVRYEDKSVDSAIFYSKRMLETAGNDTVKRQRAKINIAFFMIRRGEYTWAADMLASLGNNIFEQNSVRYYSALDMLHTWENEHLSPNNEIRNSKLWSYADSMDKHKHGVDLTIATAQRNIYIDPHKAIDSLLMLKKDYGDKASWRYIGKRLALSYQELGKRDSAEYYFALSALADMEGGVVEHTSLHLLTLMLLEDGDIERAYRYARATMEDAMTSGVKLRLEQVARSMPTILDAYHKELGNRQRRINIILFVISVLLFVGSGLLYYTYRTNKRLASSRRKQRTLNEELKQKERLLSESLQRQTMLVEELSKSSNMKDVYVGQYMRQCVNNLQQLEQYRLSLQKVAMQGNMDKLVTAIKKKDFIEKEMESFYRGFDETFLQIFPHFVDDFNALLQEENRITVPEGKLLTVDLRIHALIRLGLTETEDIAKFLHYSTQTIYNYRSRIRNSAICKEDFEEKVKEL